MTDHQGSPFIDFTLGSLDTRAARANHPLLVIFWRTGCPTCRFALPFFDRMARAYPSATVAGISQDSRETTTDYCLEQGIAMDQVIDEDLAVTRSYGLTVVPSYVLTDASGSVLEAGEGWDRALAEKVSRRIAEAVGEPAVALIGAEETVPAFKPG
ncbi:MAG: redoxin family protein [Fimbriimonadaceae bacterium]|nr:redoxin family protein [Fimbriimonadaceae bacterium]